MNSAFDAWGWPGHVRRSDRRVGALAIRAAADSLSGSSQALAKPWRRDPLTSHTR